MSDFAGVFTDEQKRALTLLRVIWAVLLLEVVVLGAVVYLILIGGQQAGAPPAAAGDAYLIVSLVAVLVGAAVGYFLRMQAYKQHWVGNRIEKPGYFTGNLLLFALIEIGAIAAIVCAYLAGGVGRELLPLVLSLILLALNFPNGRPMLADGGGPSQPLTR